MHFSRSNFFILKKKIKKRKEKNLKKEKEKREKKEKKNWRDEGG